METTKKVRVNASLKVFKILGERQKWRCRKCKHRLKSTAQIDHRLPLFKGGTNLTSNLQILCVHCHSKKSQRESSNWKLTKVENASHSSCGHSDCVVEQQSHTSQHLPPQNV